MKHKEIGIAERALINAKIEMKKLKRSKRTKEINKRIKKLEGSFPQLNRNAYLEKQNNMKVKINPSEKEIIEEEHEALAKMVNDDLKRRKTKQNIKHYETISSGKAETACQSCGAPLIDVYGILRCKCN